MTLDGAESHLQSVGHLHPLLVQSALQLHLLVEEVQPGLSSLVDLLLPLPQLAPQALGLLFCCHLEGIENLQIKHAHSMDVRHVPWISDLNEQLQGGGGQQQRPGGRRQDVCHQQEGDVHGQPVQLLKLQHTDNNKKNKSVTGKEYIKLDQIDKL
ncbi:hypothetical protein F7725_009512 [Dissostichus mawsoni]|uniref:Uncharacterized protein n=1 Tax=Dissostichus mawsoni TaxID=36200 RepID=A0A7J5XKZ5_DISMA|nr:hypothetical protein F7725_009512 [Dissostichus mawsoni]